MRSDVKRWWSEDLPDAKSLPEDPDDCCVGMHADIGPVGEEGADTFGFEVCTPSALAPVGGTPRSASKEHARAARCVAVGAPPALPRETDDFG
jgi:hypothetical protein